MPANAAAFYRRWNIEVWLVIAGIVVTLAAAITQRIILDQQQLTPISGSVPTNEVFASALGVPLDDVYIHCQFARNIATGASYSFNSGETLTADTSPLWVILLAACSLVTTHLEVASVLLSILFYLVIGPGVYRVMSNVLEVEERVAILAGMLAVICSRLCWSAMSGMETSLAALLMLLVVEEHLRQRRRGMIRYREGLWLGLGILTRPEFWFVGLVLAVDWAIHYFRWRKYPARDTIIPAILTLAIASPSFLLPLLTRGGFVSHSSVVQGVHASSLPDIGYLWFAIKIFASSNVVVAILVIAGCYFVRHRSKLRLLLIICIGLPLVQSFVAPQFRHHGRYMFPLFPVYIMAGALCWEYLLDFATFNSRFWRYAIPIVAIAVGLIDLARWDVLSAQSVRNINDQHLAAAYWLKKNLQPADTLAAQDVGAIEFITNRRVIDLVGLTTPELYPIQQNQDAVWRKARAEGANVFVIYNRLNPTFYTQHQDSLILQQQFRIRKPLVSSADTVMSIYRIRIQGAS